MVNVHPDVSEYQPYLDSSFNRQFVMFRSASEYDRPDKKYPVNCERALAMRSTGKLINFGTYEIPGVVPNDALLGRLDAEGFPHDAVVMIDSERWGSLVTGDHSAQFNALAEALRKRQGGRDDLVWGYSNRGDFSIWSKRPAWLGFIVAGYNNNDPRDEGLGKVIGWQYCNAVENHTSYPSSTPPFGRCDHNVMFIDYPKPNGDDMYDAAAEKRLLDHIDAKFDAAHTDAKTIISGDSAHPNSQAALAAKLNSLVAATNPATLAGVLAPLLTAAGPVTQATLEAALRTVLGSVDNVA